MSVNIGPIRRFEQSGTGNMGSIENRYSGICRFRLPVPHWVLVYYRVVLGQSQDPTSGTPVTAPTGTADLEVRVDHGARGRSLGGDGTDGTPVEVIPYSFIMHKSLKVGVGNANINVRFTDEEMQANTMTENDWAVFVWPNPETDGSLKWTLEAGLAERQ